MRRIIASSLSVTSAPRQSSAPRPLRSTPGSTNAMADPQLGRCGARRGPLHRPVGHRKTTLDDLAREAGLSRATTDRVFPGGKDHVVAALVQEGARASSGSGAPRSTLRRPSRTCS